jgi:hypothetical protein
MTIADSPFLDSDQLGLLSVFRDTVRHAAEGANDDLIETERVVGALHCALLSGASADDVSPWRFFVQMVDQLLTRIQYFAILGATERRRCAAIRTLQALVNENHDLLENVVATDAALNGARR